MTMIVGLILLSVTMSAFAQIILKLGMSSERIRAGLDIGSPFSLAFSIASSPLVIAGFALYGLGALLWLGVLARIEVSRAYPFVGLGFLLTMILAVLFQGEKVTVVRLAGTLMIAGGVVLVARS